MDYFRTKPSVLFAWGSYASAQSLGIERPKKPVNFLASASVAPLPMMTGLVLMFWIEAFRPKPNNPLSAKRQSIDDLLAGGGNNSAYDSIGLIKGIEIIERRDWRQDGNKRCHWYVFKGEPWWDEVEKNHGLDALGLFNDTKNYLSAKGYIQVRDPRNGDIIVYMHHDKYAKHFGIYLGEGKVISKFNDGHIFRHDIDMVPNSYGEEYIFLRKSEASQG